MARREAAAGVGLTCGVADFRALESEVAGAFDLVIACDNALPHLLSESALRQATDGMRAKLRPDGLLLLSMRDYDALRSARPGTELPRVIDDNRDGRRVVFQVWDWCADGETYDLTLFILREIKGRHRNTGGWQTVAYTTRYRAFRRDDLTAALRESGFAAIRWLTPEETGFYQPIVTARRR